MRTLFLCLLLLAAIIGIGLFFQKMLAGESQDMIGRLQDIQSCILDDKWEQAGKNMSDAAGQWQHIRKKWHAITDHTQIGIIDESLARLQVFVKQKEKKDCLAEIAALQQNIRYIPDKEKLTLSNIF